MITFWAIIGFLYVIIGRVIILQLESNCVIDFPDYDCEEYWATLGAIFFPFVLLYVFIKYLSHYLSDLFDS